MLEALRFPFSFVVLLATFVVGICARGFTQRMLTGQRRPAWARRLVRRTSLLWLRPFVDPYGALSALLGGLGWGAGVEIAEGRGRPRGRTVAALVAGPVVLAGLGVGALLGFRALSPLRVGGRHQVLAAVHGGVFVRDHSHIHYLLGYGQVALLLAGLQLLGMGVLAVLPIPPLDGGRLLFALAPRSRGWQRARYRLEEDSWGVLIVLLLAFPVFGDPLALSIVDAIADPLIRTLVG